MAEVAVAPDGTVRVHPGGLRDRLRAAGQRRQIRAQMEGGIV
jgi:hypothetical protein